MSTNSPTNEKTYNIRLIPDPCTFNAVIPQVAGIPVGYVIPSNAGIRMVFGPSFEETFTGLPKNIDITRDQAEMLEKLVTINIPDSLVGCKSSRLPGNELPENLVDKDLPKGHPGKVTTLIMQFNVLCHNEAERNDESDRTADQLVEFLLTKGHTGDTVEVLGGRLLEYYGASDEEKVKNADKIAAVEARIVEAERASR